MWGLRDAIDWLILTGIVLSWTTLVIAVGRCLAGIVSNLADIRPRPSRLDTLHRVSEDMATWIGLPLIAYLASVATNIGTTLAMDAETDDQFGVALNVLSAGGAALVVVSGIAVDRRRRRNQRGPWSILTSWPDARAEVLARDARTSTGEEAAWAADARDGLRRLARTSSRGSRSAVRARRLLGPLTDWQAGPRWGLGPYRPAGSPCRVPARTIIRWSARRPGIAYGLYGSCASIATWLGLLLAGDVTESAAAKYGSMAAVALLCSVLAGRADLIFHRRLHTRNAWFAAESFGMLRRMHGRPRPARPRMPLRRRQRRAAGAAR